MLCQIKESVRNQYNFADFFAWCFFLLIKFFEFSNLSFGGRLIGMYEKIVLKFMRQLAFDFCYCNCFCSNKSIFVYDPVSDKVGI